MRHIVACVQVAADPRFEAEDGEEICARTYSADPLRRAGAVARREIQTFAPDECDVRKAALCSSPVTPVRHTDGSALERVRTFAQFDKVLRLRIRQRPEQNGIDDAEDRGVRTDPEREGKDRDDGEARMLEELANCVTNVAHHNRSLIA